MADFKNISAEAAPYFTTSLVTGEAHSGQFGDVDLTTASLDAVVALFKAGFPYLKPTDKGLQYLSPKDKTPSPNKDTSTP